LIAFGSSLDQIGVLSGSVYDSAKIVDMMKGKDKKDSTSIDYKKDLTARFGRKLEGLRVAVPDIVFSQEIPQEIKDAFSSSLELLKKCGSTIIPI
jgi:aspartyl-tRNA(Asn)/glutamyl-tRNA(Gln) amidotransferase subunit A